MQYLANTWLHYVAGSEIASSSDLEIVSDGSETQENHWAYDYSTDWLWSLGYNTDLLPHVHWSCSLMNLVAKKGGTTQRSHFRFYFCSVLHTIVRTERNYAILQGAEDHSVKSKFRPLPENVPCLQMSSNRNLWIIAWYLFWTLAWSIIIFPLPTEAIHAFSELPAAVASEKLLSSCFLFCLWENGFP